MDVDNKPPRQSYQVNKRDFYFKHGSTSTDLFLPASAILPGGNMHALQNFRLEREREGGREREREREREVERERERERESES